MIAIRTVARTAGLGLTALALSACVTVFPKTKPAQLYRFGAPLTQANGPATADPANRVGVARAVGDFDRPASGDRMLTVTGAQVAYLADSRWVAPASVLFDEAVLRAFDADGGSVRLINRGEPARAPYALRLDVERFEADYDRSSRAPTVNVTVHAVLIRADDHRVVHDQTYRAQMRAADDRVGAIVAAYDQAVSQVLGEIVAMTKAEAKPA